MAEGLESAAQTVQPRLADEQIAPLDTISHPVQSRAMPRRSTDTPVSTRARYNKRRGGTFGRDLFERAGWYANGEVPGGMTSFASVELDRGVGSS